MFEDTIAAISTSALSAGAISIVRLSGKDCFDVLNRVFRCRAEKYEGYRIYYGHIVDPLNEEVVDEVLVSIFRAPHSFTGENMAEINCHGGLYITRRSLTLLLSCGARQALNGEFTKRAFLNGRIDLTQAEAVNDLITADSHGSARLAVNSLSGSVSRLLKPLISDLEQVIAHIEVNIDYPEYDDNGIITASEIAPLMDDWLSRCDRILQAAESTMIIREGIRTVIVGKPNVGKSSLLNALLAQDKAIVSEYAGTTRDLVEGDIHLGNVTLHLIDTAGIHKSDDYVESIGIQKSLQALQQAQLVIVILDGSAPLDQQDQEILARTESRNRIVVYNKADIERHDGQICVSALNGDVEQLVERINEMFASSQLALDQPVLSNERQISLMRQAREYISPDQLQLSDGIPLDLLNEDIQAAYRCLKEILGQYSREDLLDGIFSRFCVGK